LIGHGSVPLAVVIGLKHLYLNTEQTLAYNLSILLNIATQYRGSGLVHWPFAPIQGFQIFGY
jgi:hypothetical protein